jgi:hypothetical protein
MATSDTSSAVEFLGGDGVHELLDLPQVTFADVLVVDRVRQAYPIVDHRAGAATPWRPLMMEDSAASTIFASSGVQSLCGHTSRIHDPAERV